MIQFQFDHNSLSLKVSSVNILWNVLFWKKTLYLEWQDRIMKTAF